MAWVNRKRVKCHIHHFRFLNNTFISDKMGENARSNFFDASKCLSEAYCRAYFGIQYVLV